MNKKEKNEKNYKIEFYRFLFMIVIMLNHVNTVGDGLGSPIPLGHVFVEFFFFLTGFFTYSHIRRGLHSNPKKIDEKFYPFRYTFRKIHALMPYVVMTCVIFCCAVALERCFIQKMPFKSVLYDFSGVPFDFLLLQITGINSNSYFSAWWYLSAVAFALPLVFILFYKKIELGGVYCWGMYYLPLIIYGAFAMHTGGLAWGMLAGFTRSGFFRGFAGLCIGGIIYELSEKLLERKCGLLDQMILTFVETGSFLLSICIAWKWSRVSNSTFLVVLLLFAGLIISFGNQSYTTVFQSKLFGILGTISVPLYVSHFSVGKIVGIYSDYFDIDTSGKYIIYVTMSILIATIMVLVKKISNFSINRVKSVD